MRSRSAIAALGIFVYSAIASAANPTNDEQYFLEITNRMRLNPRAELAILTNINPTAPATWATPKSDEFNSDYALGFFNVNPEILRTQWNSLVPVPALAWNSSLHDAALFHANSVIEYSRANPTAEAQLHDLPLYPTFVQRLQNVQYQYTAAAENLYAYAYNAFHGHAGFAIDWGEGQNPDGSGIQNPPGHRNNIMSATYRETGLSILSENNLATPVGPLITNMDFGRRSGNAFLTGVVYNDFVDANHFYNPGEGLGGVTVQVFNAGTSTLRFDTTTWSAGGYTLQLPAGTYDVKLSGGALPGEITYRNVAMGTNNVKIDSLSSWIAAGGGSWTSAASWNAGVPNGIGTRAFLTGSSGVISINTPVTVGTIDFDSGGGYTLGGAGSISLDVSTGQARINSIGTSHNIATPVALSDDTTINISGELALSGGLQNPSGRAITRSGAGMLRIAGPQNHGPGSTLLISAGSVKLQSDVGTPASASSVAVANLSIDIAGINSKLLLEADQNLRSLAIAHAGSGVQSIDLAGHALHIYPPTLPLAKTSLYSAIQNTLLGPVDGIFDSTLASHINAAVGLGIVPDAHGDAHLLIRPTRIGDLNLDGNVTIADFIDLASNFNLLGIATWQEGDLNRDGSVTISDFIDLASNFNTSYSGEVFPISAQDEALLANFAASIGATVPEPSAISALSVSALILLTRRRRR